MELAETQSSDNPDTSYTETQERSIGSTGNVVNVVPPAIPGAWVAEVNGQYVVVLSTAPGAQATDFVTLIKSQIEQSMPGTTVHFQQVRNIFCDFAEGGANVGN